MEIFSIFLYNLIMIVYLIIINILSFILMYIDKLKAIKGRFRISEDVLLGLSLIGGSLGVILSMYLFHHKTRKFKFKIVLFILIIQIIVFIRFFL